ncbi:hypothetical protein Hypma_002391 [Hypsizygus marmoreus]|uniref:Uncharacterized protein n=1 Tax=Hypsizygus marmoreus TaxID=39966 RepID=A0A369J4G5_HYPMA|nr:hypothetical protein Hypma_002391 [Hypsizygus marmoreus]
MAISEQAARPATHIEDARQLLVVVLSRDQWIGMSWERGMLVVEGKPEMPLAQKGRCAFVDPKSDILAAQGALDISFLLSILPYVNTLEERLGSPDLAQEMTGKRRAMLPRSPSHFPVISSSLTPVHSFTPIARGMVNA